MPDFFMALGTFLVWIAGYFLSWRNTAYVSMVPSILLTLIMISLPETPYWLIEADKIELAEYVILHKYLLIKICCKNWEFILI